jgi:hypothetical protein
MSEEKIIKHTENAVHIVTSKEKKWKEKVKDIFLEIIIIVFAVSITLWFHNWNDRVHEREMEKNFLIGLRNNLKTDTANLDYSITFLQAPISYYENVLKQINENKIDTQYIDNNSSQLINDLYFDNDNGLFESFKSAGNLRLIENQNLLSEITSLYTASYPFVENHEADVFKEREQEYSTYIGSKYGMDSNWNSKLSAHINDPAIKFHIQKYEIYLNAMNDHRKDLLRGVNKVLEDINKELSDRFGVKGETEK